MEKKKKKKRKRRKKKKITMKEEEEEEKDKEKTRTKRKRKMGDTREIRCDIERRESVRYELEYEAEGKREEEKERSLREGNYIESASKSIGLLLAIKSGSTVAERFPMMVRHS